METHRIDGIKYNFDRMSDDELENMRDHLLTRHQKLTEDIEVVDQAIFERNHDQIPFDIGVIAVEHGSEQAPYTT